MITIKRKQYEIEDTIRLLDNNDETLYEFNMQLTSEDLKELEKALFGEDIINLAKKIKNMEDKTLNEDEEKQVIELGKQLNSSAESLIEKLCFKDHKEKFIELGGQTKYDETLELISDYLLTFFMNRQASRINTINSGLAKILEK